MATFQHSRALLIKAASDSINQLGRKRKFPEAYSGHSLLTQRLGFYSWVGKGQGQFRRVRAQAFYNYTNKGFAGLRGASGAWVSGRGRAAGCISTHVVVAAVPAWRVLGARFFRERFRTLGFGSRFLHVLWQVFSPFLQLLRTFLAPFFHVFGHLPFHAFFLRFPRENVKKKNVRKKNVPCTPGKNLKKT